MSNKDPFGGATIPSAPVAYDRPSIGGLGVQINMPQALVSKFDPVSGEEIDQGLPPYAPRKAYKVDDCDARAPADWKRGDPTRKSDSYFTAIKPGHGLWLDFSGCLHHTHDVAAVVSIQGVNSVSGRPVEDLSLEKYVSKCPLHGTPFNIERHCDACGYKWPAQNYLATTGNQGGFWIDGFRTPDGAVRQYVFTADEKRGVASQIVGPGVAQALGIVFYLSKEAKPRPVYRTRGGGLESLSMADSYGSGEESALESVHVAAGARIKQQVYADPKPMDYWCEEPAGMLYVYYVTEDRARAILGLPPENREGFLGGLRTGHQRDPFSA